MKRKKTRFLDYAREALMLMVALGAGACSVQAHAARDAKLQVSAPALVCEYRAPAHCQTRGTCC